MGASGSSPFPAAESVPRSFAPRAELSPRRAASSCTITSWAGAAIDGARAGADPELARRRASALCNVLGPPPLPWPTPLDLERGSQMWSMRRKALGSRPDGRD
jgi:hypothetical protein